ncbi:Uncharacterized protein DAT39_005604 [Clarias magur]|uniref:Uncharacterized protein n=1 Tax=Clarias magur TaxID=1594786 RepID=A0A8J4USL1_CLAMG|nr:Uncharacterized protein DAT39_005604 [Clarias magur]
MDFQFTTTGSQVPGAHRCASGVKTSASVLIPQNKGDIILARLEVHTQATSLDLDTMFSRIMALKGTPTISKPE